MPPLSLTTAELTAMLAYGLQALWDESQRDLEGGSVDIRISNGDADEWKSTFSMNEDEKSTGSYL